MSQIHCLTCQCEARTVADRLRAWRWRKVAATGRPAFVFLYDSELSNLSAFKPKTLGEVCMLVAPQRHLWADELLALIHPEHYSLPPAERGAPSPDPGPLGEDEWDPWPPPPCPETEGLHTVKLSKHAGPWYGLYGTIDPTGRIVPPVPGTCGAPPGSSGAGEESDES